MTKLKFFHYRVLFFIILTISVISTLISLSKTKAPTETHATVSQDVNKIQIPNYLKNWNDRLNSGQHPMPIFLALLDDTHKLIVSEQIIEPIRVTERPISLEKQLNCSNIRFKSFLELKPRNGSKKIYDLIIFSFELIILDIRLYELYDVVDEFIIFESNITFKKMPKPFFFLENIKRYQRFLNKIVLITPFNVTRFNQDLTINERVDVNLMNIDQVYRTRHFISEHEFVKTDFKIEARARMLPLDLYSTYERQIEPDDLIIHGDVDEIPNGNIINHFKNCIVKEEFYPYGFWTTFFIYSFKFVFQSHSPANSDVFSTKYPNIMRMKDIKSHKMNRFRDGNTLLPRASACHLNRFFSSVILGLYKSYSQSDSNGMGKGYLNMLLNGSLGAYETLLNKYKTGTMDEKLKDRVTSSSIFSKNDIFIPWVVYENKDVFKRFFD